MLQIDEFKKRFYAYFAPPTKQTVSQWADANRMLSSENSAEPGRWRTERASYQREIMDAISDPGIEKVVVQSSSQVGKSEILNNTIGAFIDQDPCPILMIQPTDQKAKDYSKERIAPLIRDTKSICDKVSDAKSRDTDNTILMKSFAGGFLALNGANAPAGLASRPIRVLLCDEVDRYPDSAGTEGDPIKLAEKRTITFWNRKKVFTSTPGNKGTSRIEKEYISGTQEEWRIKCPHCGEPAFINLYGMIYKHKVDDKGNHLVTDIVFRCPHCMSEFSELAWKAQPGSWVAQNPTVEKVRSFKLNAFVSPWLTWEDILKDYFASKDDPELYKVFVNTMLGETYEVKGEIENEDDLLKRREVYDADLPDGVLFLTAAVDTQDRWLEYEVVGWGKGEESWGIRHGVVMGVPDRAETWQGIHDILTAKYRFKNGLGLTVACACIDSGGHYTTAVYEYCKANENRRFFAIKGQGGAGIPLMYKITRTKKENAALIILGVDEGKTAVIENLKIKKTGPHYCHFPLNDDLGYDSVYMKGLISERQIPRKYKGKIVINWEKVSPEARNEPFDLRNYARAALKLMSPNFEQYEKRLHGLTSGQNVKQESRPEAPKKQYGVVKKSVDY